MTKPKATLNMVCQQAHAGPICQLIGFAQNAALARKSSNWLRFDFPVFTNT